MELWLTTSTFFKYLVLIIIFTCAGSEKFRCDYKYSAIAEGWLKYQEIPATWFDARLRCALEGIASDLSTLVIIPQGFQQCRVLYNRWHISISDYTRIRLMSVLVNLLNDDGNEDINKEIFTGIHATFSKGDYYSVDGVPLSVIPHKWEAHEPNNINNDENCLTINNKGLLSDVNCNRTLPYYCFKSENSTEEMDDCGTVEPEYIYDNRTNSCYKFHTVPRTFSRAFFACSAEGGHLVIINNGTEAVVIKELFSKYPASSMIGNFSKDVAFVGFSDWGEHGDWRTIHGQTLLEAGYATFAYGEPNRSPSGGEYCGSVYRNAELNDADCDESHAFICEKAPEYPAVCSQF